MFGHDGMFARQTLHRASEFPKRPTTGAAISYYFGKTIAMPSHGVCGDEGISGSQPPALVVRTGARGRNRTTDTAIFSRIGACLGDSSGKYRLQYPGRKAGAKATPLPAWTPMKIVEFGVTS
jgi:hypothetical protein